MTKKKTNKASEPAPIKFDELMNELERVRAIGPKKTTMTKEQAEFMKKARENATPVSYENMAKLWVKAGWGYLSTGAMRERWILVQQNKVKIEE